MDVLFASMKTKLLCSRPKRIVFPEHEDERVLRAANRLANEGLITPVYIGTDKEIKFQARRFGVTLRNYEVVDPHRFAERDALLHMYIERRSGRIDEQVAAANLLKANYFATLLVHAGWADGLVSGAMHTTTDAALPALQIIKPKATMKKVSGAYLLVREAEQYIFADCAIHINPTSEELAEITLQSAETASLCNLDPKVAMLSFSTKGSAHSPETEKITSAVRQVQQVNPTLAIDGEVQFDVAYMPSLAAKKTQNMTLTEQANVFVFPNLEAGNISYKIAERLGGFQAIGPIMQGLNRPVNLLSRGCSEADIYKVALFTAMQAVSSAHAYV